MSPTPPGRTRPGRTGLAILTAALIGAAALAAGLATIGGDDHDTPAEPANPSPAGEPDGDAEPAGGEPVPDLALTDFNDQPVALTDYAGQPLVVNFFASWCPPCVAEMRDALQPAHTDLGDDIAFVGIAMQDTPQAALDVVDDTGVTYDLARDPDGQLFAALGLGGMPSTVYITADHHIAHRHTGSLTHDQLQAQIEQHLTP